MCNTRLAVLTHVYMCVHRFIESGGIDILVSQMDRYRGNSKIQRACCWAIVTLCGSDDDSISRTLVHTHTTPSTASTASNPTNNNTNNASEAAAAATTPTNSAHNSRAVLAILNAMCAHSDDTGVQQFGCWAISNMAIAGEDVRRKLRKAGAVEVVRMAMDRHGEDVEVVRQARGALGVLGNNTNAAGGGASK
jgi:hypothetical protein